MSRRSRLAALGALLAAALPSAAFGQAGAPPSVVGAPASLVAGHFRLVASDGTTVDSDELVGRPYGLFFGFTDCPDICPTTLSDLTLALRSLPPAAAALRIYFVSVDPADTAERLAQYAANFDPRIVALGGEPDAVAEAISTFGIRVEKTDLGSGRFAYGHTASVFLVDGDGVIVDRATMQDGPAAITSKLARLVGIPSR